MTPIPGDRIRHVTRGVGTVERIERNAFGTITRAHVRFSGVLARVWIEDAAVIEPRAIADDASRLDRARGDGGRAAP